MQNYPLIFKASFLFFAATLCLAGRGYAAEFKWVYYGSASDGSLSGYYSPETANCQSGGTMDIWTKEVSNRKNVTDMAKTFGPKFKNLGYTLNHKRLDCANKRLANLGMLYYSKKDVLIGKAVIDKPRWKPVKSGSMGDGLMDGVCGLCRKNPPR
ncbi:MAG TPA: surface-adhesin E family protein [Geobacteraceae bacterium]|nr:surface-adhesin E family protein [Geobacteraceae bacterium]